MQHNLEDISYTEVTDEKGMSYASWRGTLAPRFKRVFFDISKGYFFLLLFAATAIFLTQHFFFYWWLIIPPAAIAFGYTAAYLALFIHEAGHFNIHPDKKKNDRLATLFLCLPFGLSIKSYRKIHWQHHVHLGTPADAEVSYFHGLTKMFLAETLTGLHLLRTMRRKDGNNVLNEEQRGHGKKMLLSGIIFHIIILSVLIITGNWPVAIAWLIGFGIFFPFFATIRQVLEHRDELAQQATDYYKEPHGKVSRLFVTTLLSSSFGSAGFTRHMIHHWDPQVSYTRLKDIEDFLLKNEKTAAIIRNSKTTYLTVFKKLVAAP